MEELKIIEPVKSNLKHFKTTEEFNIYYVKNKEELEEMTTQKLNKLFNIDGYRITKIGTRDKDGKRVKGSICLKKCVEKDTPDNNETLNLRIEDLEKTVKDLKEQIKILSTTINQIVDTINS